jgi:hypothetical protein
LFSCAEHPSARTHFLVLSAGNHNFTLADFAGASVAFVLFSCLTVLTGYTLGWLLNVLRFRQRESSFRFAISVPVAIALGPVLSYFIGRWLSLGAACAFYAVLSVGAVPLIAAARRRPTKMAVAWPLLAWCLLAMCALSDMQIGRRLYFSIIAFDYAVRTAFAGSIGTFGLPAQNPFFYPGYPVALRYHYFWLIQPALVHMVAAPYVSVRQALIGGTMWCGIGLIAAIALYLRFFRIAPGRLSRQLLIAISLLTVTGLDIIPALFFLMLVKCGLIGVMSPSIEWWNDQVDGWLYSVLFEPHYVAGLIACLLGFLVISRARGGRVQLISSGVVAGLSFATSVGAAIYVAFVFALFLLIWCVVVLMKRRYQEFFVLAVAGLTAALCSWPFLAGLRGPVSGGAFLHLTVRSFFVVDVLVKMLHFDRLWQTYLANLLFLPLNYFIELGLFFAVGVLEWRRLQRMETIRRDDLALGIMALVSILVCTFVRSGVIANNDLGWRGFLIAQFVLLIRGAQLLPAAKSKKLLALAALGLAGTIYDQALLRFYAPLSDAKFLPKVAWLASDEKLGARTYANRQAYEWLRAHSKPQSIVQQNPLPVIQESFYGLYANRRTLAEDSECATTFGGDLKACAPLQKALRPLFLGQSPAQALDAVCAALRIDFLVAKDTDAAWHGRESWVWRRTPVFANRFVRIFSCAPRQ